jgi:glyoxylase-like metal-dependent hydrolase (beta-lactamase superfamily II)
MKRILVLAGLLVVGTVSMLARQGPAPPTEKLDVEKLKDNLYVIKGFNGQLNMTGGNVAAFITARGVVVVDTKYAGWGPKILEAIRSFTDKPITTIINTHTHGDHTGANAEFPATVEIIAHENTKTNMEKMPAFQGDKAQFLPKRTFKDKLTVGSGAERIDLYYFGPGHTSGDALIVFPAQRVLHTGDLFSGLNPPLIDRNNGGTGLGYPATIKKAVAGIKDIDTVIPGHNPILKWSDFTGFADFMTWFVSAAEKAAKDGKTAEEAAKELAVPEKFKNYNMQRGPAAIATIYGELKK